MVLLAEDVHKSMLSQAYNIICRGSTDPEGKKILLNGWLSREIKSKLIGFAQTIDYEFNFAWETAVHRLQCRLTYGFLHAGEASS